jgi:2-polyprenyl-6-methoxyphenol hydroxylase-like FAD-dependent oxidoreductase
LAPAAVVAHKADAGGVTATLKDGRTVRASLLVSAEGRRSSIRAAEGIRTTGWKYNQTAVVCTVAHEKPHDGVAHEYFLPSGPFAMLPLTDNRTNIVWTETPEISDALMKMSEADFLSELRVRFGDNLGALSLTGRRKDTSRRAWRCSPIPRTACIQLRGRGSMSVCAMWPRSRNASSTARAWGSSPEMRRRCSVTRNGGASIPRRWRW